VVEHDYYILWEQISFNMVMATNEKSTGNVNKSMIQLFNDIVSDTRLMRQLHIHGGNFTWTNK